MKVKIPIPLLSTVFIDLMGLGIMIPLFAPMILSTDLGILHFDTSFADRNIILGFLLGSYPLSQFFGAPFLGTLSDIYGRKKILFYSLIGTLVGAITTAYGIYSLNIYLVFLGRFIDGFTGGNTLIVFSSIADITPIRERSTKFGIIAMAFGIGFLIGPVIGATLSDSSLVSWFGFSTPFWFTSMLTGINAYIVHRYFKETLKTSRKVKVNIFLGFNNIKKAFNLRKLRTILLVEFTLSFGLNFFIQFYQVFLIKKYSFDQVQIGYLFGYIGLWMAFTQGFLNPSLVKKMHSHEVLKYTILITGLLLPTLILPEKSIFIYAIVPFIAIFQGISHPNITSVVSGEAQDSNQGEILGISQSIASIAYSLPPILSGFLVSINVNLPIIVSSILILLSWVIYITLFKTNHPNIRNEQEVPNFNYT